MPGINQNLFEQLRKKLQISKSATYARIDKKSRSSFLPRRLAALALAAENGINIQKYAKPEDLAELRGNAKSETPAVRLPAETQIRAKGRTKSQIKNKRKPTAKRRGNSVFVVHGRNEKLRKSLF